MGVNMGTSEGEGVEGTQLKGSEVLMKLGNKRDEVWVFSSAVLRALMPLELLLCF